MLFFLLFLWGVAGDDVGTINAESQEWAVCFLLICCCCCDSGSDDDDDNDSYDDDVSVSVSFSVYLFPPFDFLV